MQQVNVWLLICGGEFIRAIIDGEPFKAGLWLGGWLLKPQLLILIIPFLLLSRSVKIFTGFISTTIVAIVVSLALIGFEGFLKLFSVVMDSATGFGSNPYYMVNWRMLGSHIAIYSNKTIGLIIVTLGTIVTLYLTYLIFKEKLPFELPKIIISLLGIFAATCAVTWHAHLHIAVILIPPMIYLLMINHIDRKLFLIWIFAPGFIFFLSQITNLLIYFLELPINRNLFTAFSKGFPGLVMNLMILVWSVSQINGNKQNFLEG
jgi:hypothetical protein